MHTDPRFLIEVGALLLLLGAAGALAWRIGLSAVPLFLLAGLAVGDGGVFPAPSAAGFLEFSSGIGVVLLMLTLGLEFSSSEFSSSVRRHAPSGVVDLVLNATPGVVAGLLLGLPPAGVVALAGITWVSSSGIVARTLVDLGKLGYRETPSVLSVLVLEDIAMAAYLPVLGVLLSGGTAAAGAIGVAVAVGAVTIVLLLSRRMGPHLERLLTHDSDEQVMLRALGLTLVVTLAWPNVSGSPPPWERSWSAWPFPGRPRRQRDGCSTPCEICSRPRSSCHSGITPIPPTSRRCCPRPWHWPP